MKKKSLNKEPWFLDNGYVFLEMKCKVKHLRLIWKILAHFMMNHAKDVFGDRAVYIPFKKGKTGQVELNIQQHQKRLHCRHLKTPPFRHSSEMKTCAIKQSSGMRIEEHQTASSRLFSMS